MKNIFFYANIQTWDKFSGIRKKVMNQIDAFKELGYEVYYSGYLEDGIGIFKDNKILLKKKYFFKNEKINHILRRYLLILLCIQFFKEQKIQFKYSYLRYHYFDFLYLKLLKLMKKNGSKVIIEAHSYPTSIHGDYFKVLTILDKIYSKKIKKYCDLIAAMTNLKKIWGINTFEIDNVADINLKKIEMNKEKEENVILIAVAFEGKTHGYERIIKGLHEYYKQKRDKKVKIIFIGEYLETTKKLVKNLNLNEFIQFLGKKNKDELIEYYNRAHIGLGAFGGYKIGISYASILKTKEYMASGLPIVTAIDEKILKGFRYCLKVPNSEEIIKIEKIVEFYKNIDQEGLGNIIQEYLLENNLSYKEQSNRLLEKVEGEIK